MRISVIIPLYNKGQLVKRAIDSVLNQSFDGVLEVVVVDDGSTDDGASYVKAYDDTRVVLFQQKNGGVSSARNCGIENSHGEWLLFLDADDELLPDALMNFGLLHKMFPNCLVLVCDGIWKDFRSPRQIKQIETANPYFAMWLRGCYPAPRNTLFSRKCIDKFGKYDLRQSFFEDYEFSLRMLKCGHVAYKNQPVAIYHQDGNGLSATSHPREKEMAYYIPEILSNGTTFWERTLLFENLEMEILWWQQHGNEDNVCFYREMQQKHFCRFHKFLHWVRQKMITNGLI